MLTPLLQHHPFLFCSGILGGIHYVRRLILPPFPDASHTRILDLIFARVDFCAARLPGSARSDWPTHPQGACRSPPAGEGATAPVDRQVGVRMKKTTNTPVVLKWNKKEGKYLDD